MKLSIPWLFLAKNIFIDSISLYVCPDFFIDMSKFSKISSWFSTDVMYVFYKFIHLFYIALSLYNVSPEKSSDGF